MKRFLPIVFVLFFFLSKLQAQVYAGGEIYYEKTGNKQYKVTVHVYRECQFDPITSLTGQVVENGGGMTFNLTRIKIQRINDTCNNPCNKQNDYSNPGFEKHTFVGFVDFNQSPYSQLVNNGKCLVNFVISAAVRDTRTTTHSTSGLFYLESGVNLCDSGISSNRSPEFSMEPKFHAALNQLYCYSPGPMDTTDYDSLAFSLEPVMVGFNQSVTYTGSYSPQIPFTPYCPPNPGMITCKALPNAKPPRGFYFNPQTSQVIYTPTQANEMGYIRFKIREYRKINNKMILIGFVSRDMLVQNISSPKDIPPYFSNTLYTNLTICSDQLKLYYNAKDDPSIYQQSGDSTHILYDYAYPGSKFTVTPGREEMATLELSSEQKLKSKTTYLTVGIQAKKCNYTLSTFTSSIYNTAPVKFTKSYNIDSCKTLTYKLKTIDSTLNVSHYVQVRDSNGLFKATLSSIGKYQFTEDGKYILQYSVTTNGTCYTYQYDTVHITGSYPLANLNISKDTVVCPSFPSTLMFTPYKLKTPNSIKWYKNDTLVLLNDSVYMTTIYKSSTLTVELSYSGNCITRKTVKFTTSVPGTNLLFSSYPTYCPGDTVRIQANQSTRIKPPVTYTWDAGTMNTFSRSDTFQGIMADTFTLKIKAKDDNHCSFYDSVFIYPKSTLKFDIRSDQNKICKDSLYKVSISNLNASPDMIEWIEAGVDTIYNKLLEYNSNLKQATQIKVRLLSSTYCSNNDSISLFPIPLPDFTLNANKTSFCKGDTLKLNSSFAPYSGINGFVWMLDGEVFDTLNTQIKFAPLKSSILSLKAQNENLCFADTQINIVVFPDITPLQIISDTFYNPLNIVALSTNAVYAEYKWFNNISTRNNDFWASTLGAPGKYTVWCSVKDLNSCSSSDTLDIYTDRRTDIKELNSKAIQIYPNPAGALVHIVANQNTIVHLYSSDGKLLRSFEIHEGENTVNISQLAKGYYILRSSDGKWTAKLEKL